MKLESVPQIVSFDPMQIYNNAEEHGLGEGVYLGDNRVFRYGLVGASTIGPGKVATQPAVIANFQGMATAAASIGATQVTVTPGASTGAANLFAEGYLLTGSGGGTAGGLTLKVKSHPAISSGTAFVVTLFDPLPVALDATTTCSLLSNGYNNLITTTTQTIKPAGVPLVSVTNAYYGWFQTRGIASVLANGTPAVGSIVIVGGTTPGSVDVASSTFGTYLATMPVGKVLATAISTDYVQTWLMID